MSNDSIKVISIKERLRDSIIKAYYEGLDSTFFPVEPIDSLDLNFDNVKDLIIISQGMRGVELWDIYYYDFIKTRFVKDTVIGTISLPKFDYKNKFIYSLYIYGDINANATSFKWNGKRWIPFKRFEIIYSENNPHKATAIFRDKSDHIIKRVPITVNDWYPPTWIFR